MKKLMIVLLLFAFGLTTYTASAQATTKVDEEYKKELTKYYRLSGTDASITVVVDNVMKMMANLPEAEKINFKKEAFEKLLREMIDALAPIYKRNISLADLKELNKFYSSPAGKRISASMPKITTETMGVSMEMGKKMQETIQGMMKK